MDNLSLRPDDEITKKNKDVEETVKTYSNMIFKLCFTILRNDADAEDAVSEVFLKYIQKTPIFKDNEHKKAWLLKVAENTCRDILRFYKIRRHTELSDAEKYCRTEDDIQLFEEFLSLPVKYRTVLHLHYAEGYKTSEIAKMLSLTPSAVRKRLQYGRERLKLEYRKDVLL